MLSVLAIAIIVVCTIVMIILAFKSHEFPSNKLSNDRNRSENELSATKLGEFKKMTKAEAIAFLQDRENNIDGIPKNYIGDEITSAVILNGNTVVSDLRMIYSYDTMDDLRQLVKKKYKGLGASDSDVTDNSYEIEEYDYYAIVTPNRSKGASSCDHGYHNDCDSLLSFKRGYIDYLMKETSPNSHNEVMYFETRDPEIVEYLLRVCTFFASIGFSGGHGNIYGYSFEEQDDKFVLTVYYVGAGLNLEKFEKDGDVSGDNMYAINLFLRRYAVDKLDGKMDAMEANGSTIEIVKSFPLTKEEMKSLLED